MTETLTRIPWLTRRRVIAGAMIFVLALTVTGFVFSVFDVDPKRPLSVQLDRFESTTNGGEFIAVLNLTNRSNRNCWLFKCSHCNRIGSGLQVYMKTNIVVLQNVSHTNRSIGLMLKPGAGTQQRVELRLDGSRGRPAVWCFVDERQLPVLLHQLRQRWRMISSRLKDYVWIPCDQEIQCPMRLSDGTVEPPKLFER